MAEQVGFMRHGWSEMLEAMLDDPDTVQGPASGLHRPRGYQQMEWSVGVLGDRIEDNTLLMPTVIYIGEDKRHLNCADVAHEGLLKRFGVDLPIVVDSALSEKGEPEEIEDKTGAEIRSDPRLMKIKKMIERRHLDAEFSGEDGIEIHGFETWPQVFARVSLFVRELVQLDIVPLIMTSNGPGSIMLAQFEHNLNLMLNTDKPSESTVPGVITPEQLLENHLFKMGNAEGIFYRKNEAGIWQQVADWQRPENL